MENQVILLGEAAKSYVILEWAKYFTFTGIIILFLAGIAFLIWLAHKEDK